ncbi:MAG: hypothetical protein AAFN27_00585 [Pseudomonadota bacterium]
MSDQDIIARASSDEPELLDTATLDRVTGGAEYGGTNTCEPTDRTGPIKLRWQHVWASSTSIQTTDAISAKG